MRYLGYLSSWADTCIGLSVLQILVFFLLKLMFSDVLVKALQPTMCRRATTPRSLLWLPSLAHSSSITRSKWLTRRIWTIWSCCPGERRSIIRCPLIFLNSVARSAGYNVVGAPCIPIWHWVKIRISWETFGDMISQPMAFLMKVLL